MACFHFLSDNASDRVVGVDVVFRFITEVVGRREFFKEREFGRGYNGCSVHFMALFLMAIGRSRSSCTVSISVSPRKLEG